MVSPYLERTPVSEAQAVSAANASPAIKYKIADVCWCSSWLSSEAYITCPDCGGTGQITCVLFDGTSLSVGCEGCRRGYDAPTGKVRVYERMPRAKRVEIIGIDVSASKVEYRTPDSYIVQPDDLFDTEEEAVARAAAQAAEADRAERERVLSKEKPTKSWSWHVHYHRNCIRRAQKEIEYHTARLSVARVKAKPSQSEPAEDRT